MGVKEGPFCRVCVGPTVPGVMGFNIWARQENLSVLLDNFPSVSTRDDGNRPLNIERRPLTRPPRTNCFREYGPIPLLSDISYLLLTRIFTITPRIA